MKHNLRITLFLITLFILTQVVGLALISKDLKVETIDGRPAVVHSDTAIGARPDVSGASAFAYLVVAVFIGTVLLLVLIRFRRVMIWKLWFFLAVWLTTTVAVGVLIDANAALLISFVLAGLKIFRPNVFVHNATEVLMYSGIAILLVPLFDLYWAAGLLLVISVYDVYAVFKSKHMVKMAKFQAKSKMFAGLFIPYAAGKPAKSMAAGGSLKPAPVKNAILGGGDIAFPLIFTGVVMERLVESGISGQLAFVESAAITLLAAASLFALFVIAKKDKFYPAMPFVSAGCFMGYAVVCLINLI
ncbi:MAG: presenilin family intramembrane aspartyl protease [archaeon]